MRKLLLPLVVFFAAHINAQNNNVGVGTNTPKSKLSITDGLGVGATYSGTYTAPVDGAIIEGAVGVGTSSPDASAALDIKGSNKGVLLPTVDLTTVSWAPATGPATGLIVWNSNAAFGDGAGLYYNSGTAAAPVWLRLTTSNGTTSTVTASSPLQSSGGTTPNISLTGVVPIANGGTNAATFASNNQFLWFDGTKIVSSGYGAASFMGAATGTTNYVPKFTSANAIGNSQVFDNGTNVGVGTATPAATLDINGNLSLREGQTLVLANGGAQGGTNDNIVLPDILSAPNVKASFYRITGPTAAFSIYGITPATNADGQLVTLVNTTSFAVTIKNNGSSTAINSIKTLTGGDITSLAASSSITLQYNKTDARWYLTATQNFISPSGSIATKDMVPGTGSAVTITNGANQVVGGGNVVLDVTTNALNQKGIVSAPTALNGNQGWITDAGGNPAWAPVNTAITKKDITTSTAGVTLSNNTGQVVGSSNMSIDVATNSAASPGLVPAGTGNANKVWGTDAGGNPSWTSPNTAISTKNVLAGGSSNAVSITNGTAQVVGASDLTVDVKKNALGQDGAVPATAAGNANQVYGTDGSGNPAWGTVTNAMLANPGVTVNTGTGLTGGGTVNLGGTINLSNTGVTSVGIALPASVFNVSGTPVTTTGTLTGTLANQAANTVFAGPASGGATTPAFRALTAADLPAGGSSYVQNQFGSAQSANFWISGTGRMPVLNLTDGNTAITQGSAYSQHIATPYGYTEVGPQNGSWSHFYTDRPQYYFNKRISVDEGIISSYNQDLQLQTAGTTQITVLNANGNVGIGNPSPGRKLEVNGDIKIPVGYQLYFGENVSTTSKIGINFHTDADPNYGIYKPAGTWTQPLHIGFYTGVKIGANSSYGGTKFYSSSDMATQIMSVGDGDNHVRVSGYLFASYLNSTDNSISSGVTGVMVKQGDNYFRTATAGALSDYVNGTNTFINNQYGSAQSANHWISGSARAGEVYSDGWFRNNTSGLGLYNTAQATHFYSNNPYWKQSAAGSNYGGTVYYSGYESDLRGYVYWDGSGFGLLHNGGGWNYRNWNGGQEMYGTTYAGWSGLYANIMYDRDNNADYVDPNGNTLINAFQTNNTLAGWPGYNGITQAYGHYIWPGRNDGSGAWWQQSWYLASHSSYGLYTNTGLNINGPLYAAGNTAIDANAGWHRSYGACGWYNSTYAGGIWMQDGSWVRVYNGIPFLSQVNSGNPAIRGDQANSGWYAGEFFAYDANYGPALYAHGYMYAYQYYSYSTRKRKKDIEQFKEEDNNSALAFMDKLNLSYYRMKGEDNYPKIHVGLIAEETPTQLTAPGKQGVDYGNLSAFNTGAIKALKGKMENIEKAAQNISDFGMDNITATRQQFKFSDDFKAKLNGAQPVVTVMAAQPGVDMSVSEITKDGFIVETNATGTPAAFSWIAMAKAPVAKVSEGMNEKFNAMVQSAENDTRPVPEYKGEAPTPQIGHPAEEALEKSKIVPGNPVNLNTPNGPVIVEEDLKLAKEAARTYKAVPEFEPKKNAADLHPTPEKAPK